MIPDLAALYRPFIDAIVMVLVLIAITRLNGLRSFSKLSGFDFPITVAMGSVVASVVISKETPFLTGIAALVALFLVQSVLANLRAGNGRIEDAVDNAPLLLMEGETVFEDNLRRAKMTRSDLIGKLREANVLDPNEVRAVVFEATGDVSVLHGPSGGVPLAAMVMEDVRRGH
jgi:uncharacterized membrane protein YcaP (DUF421 family)